MIDNMHQAGEGHKRGRGTKKVRRMMENASFGGAQDGGRGGIRLTAADNEVEVRQLLHMLHWGYNGHSCALDNTMDTAI